MTRRPRFGGLLLALVTLSAVGCSGQAGAALQAVLDAAPSASQASEGESGSPTWWAHPHGYSMTVPDGWAAVDLEASSTEQLLAALGDQHPDATERIRAVLATTGARASAIAVDLGAGRDIPPLMIIVAQDASGIRPRQLKVQVEAQIASLPGLRSDPLRTDERRNGAGSVRFDYTLDDPDLGALRVSSSLFRYGGQAYVVSFVAPESAFDAARPDFELIASSLRFGI
jgi:hypothetical protein